MRHQWTVSSDYELHNKLKRLSDITRIPRSRLCDEALEDLLVKYGLKN